MKRYLLAILLVLLLPCAARAETPFVTESGNLDPFLTDHAEDALPAGQSETFDARFRVLDLNPVSDRGERFWLVRFELALSNRTNRPLREVQFAAHFDETLQKTLGSAVWYNEPVTLAAHTEADYSCAISYEWEALVELVSVGVEGGVGLEDFQRVMFEVSWKGGSEILSFSPEMDRELAQSSLFMPVPEGCGALSEDTIAQINEAGEAARIQKYGE